jgi:hypothetical protein
MKIIISNRFFSPHNITIDGSDYTGLIRQQYLLNSSRNTINVTITNDNVFELTESFSVSLSLPGSASPRVNLAVNSSSVQITILDDDSEFD